MTTNVTRLRDLKLSARDQFMIDPRIIEIEDGHNPRDYTLPENRNHLDELKANIRENGTLNPLWVRFDTGSKKAILVDGECRLRANLELIAEGVDIVGVPVIQVPGANETERLILSLTANTGKPLSKWESGKAFLRLQRFGMEPAAIAKRLGFSERFVAEAIELSDAPEEVKHMLSEQAITPSLALHELRVNGAQAVATLRQKANEAKASGQKTARKKQENRIVNPTAIVNQIIKVIESSEDEIFDDRTGDDFRFVSVEKKALRKLAEMAGFKHKERK